MVAARCRHKWDRIVPAVGFPLGDWIDDHADCRHDLGRSGMAGSVEHPRPTDEEVRTAKESDLRQALAERIRVDPGRVFLTHGATEANGWLASFLAGPGATRERTLRVQFPEYPPFVDAFRAMGFRLAFARRAAAVGVISQPRNPEGDLWPADRFAAWAEGADQVVVDETFREFGGTPSLSSTGHPGWWTTGTFTKFFGADDLRVGFVIAPPERSAAFAAFHANVVDHVPPYSVAGALATLRDQDRIARDVRAVLEPNRRAWSAAVHAPPPVAPVAFDRTDEDGRTLAERCVRASVLVCPGDLFGDPSGVRVCLTRRSFREDLAAYLDVRDRREVTGPGATGRPRRGRDGGPAGAAAPAAGR